MRQALVIGGGPAGLMAAEQLAMAGHNVIVADAKPSLGRKFLMAGKSGLNLTMDEPLVTMMAKFGDAAPHLGPALTEFHSGHVKNWASDLGQEIFTGSSGRVFPKAMKASPLLRAWMRRLTGLGIEFRTRWYWRGWVDNAAVFDTPSGPQSIAPDVTVLALGGASWPRLGSDGKWSEILQRHGVDVAAFEPANARLLVDWSDHMTKHFGAHIKNTALSAGTDRYRGEFVVSRSGLEGGGVYAVSRHVRQGQSLTLDLQPDWSTEKVQRRLNRPQRKQSTVGYLRKNLDLSPAKIALLLEFSEPAISGSWRVQDVKSLQVKHAGLGPLETAISTAGGVRFDSIDDAFMIHKLPGVFVCGEMLDWEAPTGGYLITACLATGRWAGRNAAAWRGLPN